MYGDVHGAEPGAKAAALADHELIAWIAQGDHQPFIELHGRYLRRCVSVARRVLAQDDGTADVVQSVFLDIWRRRATYDQSAGTVSSWLLAITHHRAVDYVRREDKHRRLKARTSRLPEPATAPDPAAQVIRAAQLQQVAAALADLIPAQREVIVLAYYGGHSQSQISDLLELPLGTVKSRTRDALRILRQRLDT